MSEAPSNRRARAGVLLATLGAALLLLAAALGDVERRGFSSIYSSWGGIPAATSTSLVFHEFWYESPDRQLDLGPAGPLLYWFAGAACITAALVAAGRLRGFRAPIALEVVFGMPLFVASFIASNGSSLNMSPEAARAILGCCLAGGAAGIAAAFALADQEVVARPGKRRPRGGWELAVAIGIGALVALGSGCLAFAITRMRTGAALGVPVEAGLLAAPTLAWLFVVEEADRRVGGVELRPAFENFMRLVVSLVLAVVLSIWTALGRLWIANFAENGPLAYGDFGKALGEVNLTDGVIPATVALLLAAAAVRLARPAGALGVWVALTGALAAGWLWAMPVDRVSQEVCLPLLLLGAGVAAAAFVLLDEHAGRILALRGERA